MYVYVCVCGPLQVSDLSYDRMIKYHTNIDLFISTPYTMFHTHTEEGLLATGDCAGNIHVWNMGANPNCTDWKVDSLPYSGHKGSVEDVQVSVRCVRVSL